MAIHGFPQTMRPLPRTVQSVTRSSNNGQQREHKNDQMNAQNEKNRTATANLFDQNRRETRRVCRLDYSTTSRNEARGLTSQSSQAKSHRHCDEKTSYLVAVIFISVISTGISFYVMYQVLNNADTECQCTKNKNYIKGNLSFLY